MKINHPQQNKNSNSKGNFCKKKEVIIDQPLTGNKADTVKRQHSTTIELTETEKALGIAAKPVVNNNDEVTRGYLSLTYTEGDSNQ